MSEFIDKHQKSILELLQRDGRISNVNLAEALGISESPCLRKTRALEDSGVITGYRATVDAKSVGLQISAYILVNLDQRSETETNAFFDGLQNEPRVIESVALTGSHDLLLRVVARDIDDLADLTMKGILSYDSVKDIASCVQLKTLKPPSPLPVLL